jgi:transposase
LVSLAAPATHVRLVRRIGSLLGELLTQEQLRELGRDLDLARSLCYDDGPANAPTFLTVSEAARRLRVHRTTVYRWLSDADKGFAQQEDSDLGPDRIAVRVVRGMERRLAERVERDELLDALKAGYELYQLDRERRFGEALKQEQRDQLPAQEILAFAYRQGFEIGYGTLRRWKAAGREKVGRGRPTKLYTKDEVARGLAQASLRQHKKEVEARGTLLETLRRLASEQRTRHEALSQIRQQS